MSQKQKVKAKIEWWDGEEFSQEIEVINDQNPRSKIIEWVKGSLTNYNFDDGGRIVIEFHPIEQDEYANPER